MRFPLSHLIILAAFLNSGLGAFAAAPGPADPNFNPTEPQFREELKDVPDVAGLPRVLLLGDSISIGYTRAVRAQLAGRANVHRAPENGGSTGFGLSRIDTWLGAGPWDVIHFNFGLHDLKYLDEHGIYTTPDRGRQVTPLEQYRGNLRTLITRLKRTGAKLIFATTTPVPAGSLGRVPGSEQAYNEAAVQVCRDAGVAIDDLHAFVVSRPASIQLPHNVHFTPQGSDELARAVTTSLLTVLPSVEIITP